MKTPYASTSCFKVGWVYKTSQCGPYRILGVTSDKLTYEIVFLRTGYIVTTDVRNMKSGLVKDYKLPTVLGVGILGRPNIAHANRSLYDKWRKMIKYHADPNSDTMVADEWLTFSNLIDWSDGQGSIHKGDSIVQPGAFHPYHQDPYLYGPHDAVALPPKILYPLVSTIMIQEDSYGDWWIPKVGQGFKNKGPYATEVLVLTARDKLLIERYDKVDGIAHTLQQHICGEIHKLTNRLRSEM